MELNRKSVFIPIWQFELKSKGKWVFNDFDDEITQDKTQREVEESYEDYLGASFIDGIISFAYGKATEPNDDETYDAMEIIVKDTPKSQHIRYLFTRSSMADEALWILMFKLRVGQFPPSLYAVEMKK